MVELIHFRPDSVTIPQCDLEQSTRLLLSLPLHVNGTGEESCAGRCAHRQGWTWKIILHTLEFSKGPTKVGGPSSSGCGGLSCKSSAFLVCNQSNHMSILLWTPVVPLP